MRKIKFRAFDKTNRKMIYPEKGQARLIIDLEGRLGMCNVSLHEPTYFTDDESFVLMQYTGLNDIREEKVYEGDVVEVNGFANVVIYNEDTMSFMLLSLVDEYLTLSYNDYCEMELIGNIFENPELFSDDKKTIEKIIEII